LLLRYPKTTINLIRLFRKDSQMFLFYFSILLAVISTILYHICQKLTPPLANPALTLSVTYAIALIICLVILFVSNPPDEGIPKAFQNLNWTSVGLGVAIVGIEIGVLLAYRAGWKIGVAATIINAGIAIFLLPIAFFIFKERLSIINLVGIVICVIGLFMANIRQ
jgi:drug/metabolite transporter (DMT)-like permease